MPASSASRATRIGTIACRGTRRDAPYVDPETWYAAGDSPKRARGGRPGPPGSSRSRADAARRPPWGSRTRASRRSARRPAAMSMSADAGARRGTHSQREQSRCRHPPHRFAAAAGSRRFAVLAVCCAAYSRRAPPATLASGQKLTRQWCTGCHVVGPGERGIDAAPALPIIAQRHGTDEAWVRAWLMSPHPPMPNLNLSRQEIDDVTAYLHTLQPH